MFEAETPTHLDRKLETYCQAAESTRAAHRRGGTREWMVYTAAAGSALAAAQAIDAAVIYSGVQNIMLTATGPSGGLTQGVNLDGAGGDDAVLRLGWDTGLASAIALLQVPLFVAGSTSPNAVLRMNYSSDLTQNGGFGVGGNQGILRYVLYGIPTTDPWPGGHPTSTSGFAGVAFYDPGANLHFAWLRLRIRNDANGAPDKLTLVDWAYESTAGAGIHVGSVPEPNSLALLAAGAAGVSLFRRRRKAETQ